MKQNPREEMVRQLKQCPCPEGEEMSELKTKFDLIHEAMTRVQLYPEDAETVLNRIWRVAFWRGGQNMAKVMRERGHVVYDRPKKTP